MSAAEETDVITLAAALPAPAAAFEISRSAKVVLLERESHCGYHTTTGRSAASFTENYGNGVIPGSCWQAGRS